MPGTACIRAMLVRLRVSVTGRSSWAGIAPRPRTGRSLNWVPERPPVPSVPGRIRFRSKIRALYRSIAAAMLAGRQRAAYLSGGRRGRAPVLKSPARAAWLSMFYLANAITYSQFRTTSQTTEFAPGKRPVSTRCHAADMDNPGLGLPRTTSPQALTRGLASSLVNDRMARGTPACISCSKTISACAQENGAVDRPRDAGPLSPARNL